MKTNTKKNRRQFLKNSSLAALAVGIIPFKSVAQPKQKSKETLVACDQTTRDYYGEGPFYSPNSPLIQNNQLAAENEPGTRIIISGRVSNLDCSQLIPNAIIDIWHANHAGEYDNTGYTLRGMTTSNSQGFYMFETILPGKYLNGGDFRPSHIHFKITPPGFPILTTQLYFEGDTSIKGDSAASITSGTFDASQRIIPLEANSNGKLEGTWDIIIDGDGITGVNDIHLDKGMIYKACPNPFKQRLEIKYGVFKTAKVTLKVFDVQGQQLATLEERVQSPKKYKVYWEPNKELNKGHYFIALQINDLQVHYQKVVYEK